MRLLMGVKQGSSSLFQSARYSFWIGFIDLWWPLAAGLTEVLKENVLLLTGNEMHVLMSFDISRFFLDVVLNQNDPNKEEIIVYCRSVQLLFRGMISKEA